MRRLSQSICYHCSAEASEVERRQAREGLSKQLEGAIRAVLESEAFRSSLAPVPRPFIPISRGAGGMRSFPKGGDLWVFVIAFDKSPSI